MKKIKSTLSNMKPKHWLMVSLWTLTLIFLFAFVGTVTGLSKDAKDTSSQAHWTFKLTAHGNDEVKKGKKVTEMPTKLYETKKEAMDKEAAALKGDDADWTFDKLEAGTPSSKAKSAINAIASVAFIFFLSLTAAIFTTAFIKYKDRKAGK